MKYSIFRLSDGMIVDSKESDADQLERNVPSGCGWIHGHHDYQSLRVDVETKSLVDYQPQQPSPDHEWDSVTKRWRVSARSHARAMAIAEMQRLEPRLLRPLRELSIDPTNADAKRIRDEIEARCVELRKVING